MLPSSRKLLQRRQVQNPKYELILWPVHLAYLKHGFPKLANAAFGKCSYALVGLQRIFAVVTCTKTLRWSEADSGFDLRLNIYHLFQRLYFGRSEQV